MTPRHWTRRITGALLTASALACTAGTRRPGTVLLASGADLQSINPLLTVHPLARQVQRYVLLTTLVQYDSSLRVIPYLARRWRWSPDRTVLELSLSPDLRWHDGVRTTARDAEFTLRAAADPVTGYPRFADLASMRQVQAIDDTTLRVTFTEPRDGIPDVLTDLAIVPAHLLDTIPHARLREAGWNRTPVGNGPFRFVAHEPNRRWVFERHDGFPASLGGPPKIERLVIAIVDEPITKLAALASGELDFAGINPAHAAFVRADPRLSVLSYPLLFTYGMVFNTRRPPFDDPVVRRAAALAIDRQEILDGFIYGFGTVASGPVPPELPRARPAEVPPYLPDSARGLLGNRRVRFELLTVGSGEAALEQLVQAQMARAGFDVIIRPLELSAYLERVYGGSPDFDAAVLGTSGDLALGYLATLLRLTGIQVPRGADPQEVFADSVPMTFLYHARGVQGRTRGIDGVSMDIRGELVTVTQWERVR